MPIEIVICKNYEELSRIAANKLYATLCDNPNKICFGLPTGQTPILTYELFHKLIELKRPNLDNAYFFALDDYISVDYEHSFRNYLLQRVYKPNKIKLENTFNPIDNPDYDNLIAKYQGIDLTYLGLGVNGHIAFNEPHTVFQSYTHSLQLTKSTLHANERAFKDSHSMPDKAVTVGIETILSSQQIVVLISGETKLKSLTSFLTGKFDPNWPITHLFRHSNWTMITDLKFDTNSIGLKYDKIHYT